MATSSPVTDLLSFLKASPTPWHAVSQAEQRLVQAGFRRLNEGEAWQVEPGDCVYLIRGASTLVAVQLGEAPLSETGIRWIGAHTDSPNLRIKPKGAFVRHGSAQLSVEVYGGVLLHTWLDRDLSIAGRVWFNRKNRIASALIDFEKPIARIPSLAIHLDRNVNTEGLKLNPQTHLSPLIAQLNETAFEFEKRLSQALEEKGEKVSPKDILSFELCLYEAVPPSQGGLEGEYIFSGRLDDLAMCHAALWALIHAPRIPTVSQGIVLFDHEECGSQSQKGASFCLLRDFTERLLFALGEKPPALHRACFHSLMISADMAHAVHPNHAERHDPEHQPVLGRGPVIKLNTNQRYATDGEGIALFEAWCREADVRPQHFVMRSDLACGTTIGPIVAAENGIRVIDVGNPMLSMHSIREMAATSDVEAILRVFQVFFSSREKWSP
ncbi:MAG: M18 family aminopeptidase [Sandaracinaceae bacterium]|nr:M18 family aminopeptidase [Sandaracinaceae bacterium]